MEIPQEDHTSALRDEIIETQLATTTHNTLFDMRVKVAIQELRYLPNLPPAGSRCERFPEHLWHHGAIVLNKAVERIYEERHVFNVIRKC